VAKWKPNAAHFNPAEAEEGIAQAGVEDQPHLGLQTCPARRQDN
jgi:hypothetical protein